MNSLIYQCVVNNLTTEIYNKLITIGCVCINEIKNLSNPSNVNAYKFTLDLYYCIKENKILNRTSFSEYVNSQLSYLELVDYYNSNIVGTNVLPTNEEKALTCI